ncbi:prepilin-type N-terminal cleavage/methylation domain-containing protein [Actinoplanes sp. NPDC051633]|uniref:prepilin-type N-terminal cleavage/methylation domain-containing protein n=1 Tax=Actinoplanes sp. NPDC051633 TaxID=3155670 RepID=UPI00341475C0
MKQHRAPAARDRDDAGFSLAEVVVTLSVMSVVMVVFTSAILQVYRTSAKSESISITQTQLQLAFQRFDRELRYASWIAQPGQVGTAWYVEYAGFDGSQCGQLRLETASNPDQDSPNDANGVLQWLTWPRATPPAPGTPGRTVASNLVTPDSTGPFERQTPTSPGTSGFTPDFQRLRVRVSAQVGDSVAEVDSTFTALNSSRNTPATNDCSNGRPS